MTESSPPPRLTVRQAVLWGAALLVIAALVVAFFIFGRQVAPVLGARPGEAWLTSWS